MLKKVMSVVAASGVISLGLVSPALAIEPLPAEPDALVESIAPDEMRETSTANGTLEIKDGVEDPAVTLTGNLSGASTRSTSAAVEAAEISSAEFTIDYAQNVVEATDSGLTVLEGDHGSVEAYVQQTADGVRVMTAIADSTAPSTFDYTFDVPASAELVQNETGAYIQDANGVYGVLDLPWARDASGKEISTRYSWAAGVLTQHVEMSETTAFPVLADPAWTYAYQFPTGKSPVQAESLLRGCFNCYFPVDGAPATFPAQGQLLPLTVLAIGNFECRMGSTIKVTGSLFGYIFVATENHIDGAGSTVQFLFQDNQYLVVRASIENQLVNNQLYRAGAIQTWTTFANNIMAA